MSIKRILAVVSGDEDDRSVANATLLMARRFAAEVGVLHARDASLDLAQLTGWGFEGPAYVSAAEAIESRAAAREEAARRTYADLASQFAAAAGASHGIELIIDEGREADLVIQCGAGYDLIVVRRSEAQVFDTAEAALFQTGRPVLIAPQTVPGDFGRRLLLAWNASAPAARAISAALPFARDAAAVTLFHVKTGAKHGAAPTLMLRYLQAHGIDATLDQVEPDRRAIAEVITAAARAGSCDLIVLGAYSHSRFRERILGGVTSRLLTESDLPVLMSH
jgi:nucleotide-binding universal stress UspA family protein